MRQAVGLSAIYLLLSLSFIYKIKHKMLRFISFGSGSSGNCYLLLTDTDCLMIDCGVGIRTLKKHFNQYGLKLDHVKHIILTHDHADHVKSVGSLSGDCHIPVFATTDVHRGVHSNWCVRRKINKENLFYLEKGETQQIGEFTVTSFAVPHDSTDCTGYSIVCEGVRFGLITDCGHITDEVKQCIAQSQYLVLEANYEPEKLAQGAYPRHLKERICGPKGHLSNNECAQALVENASPALRHVWLCHLSDENNHPELARLTVETILRSHGIIPGKDFQLDVLKRKSPSGIYELKAEKEE